MRAPRVAFIWFFILLILILVILYGRLQTDMESLVQDYNFILINKDSLATYNEVRSQINTGNYQLGLKELDNMEELLNEPLIVENNIESKIYYDRFIQSVQGINYIKASQKDGQKFIDQYREKFRGKVLSREDTDKFLMRYFHFKCNYFFKKVWYIQPSIVFTEKFYDFYSTVSGDPTVRNSHDLRFAQLIKAELQLEKFDRGLSFENMDDEFYSGYYIINDETIDRLKRDYISPPNEDSYQYQLYYEMLRNAKDRNALLLIQYM